MAKFCENCGAPLNEGKKFCPGCGTAVATELVQPAPPQEQPVPTQPASVQYIPPQGQQQYFQPAYAIPKRNNNKTILIIVIAAAAAVIIGLLAYNLLGAFPGKESSDEDSYITLEAFSGKPPGKETPFKPAEASFTTNDPNIKMIEINQSLSYGFDTDTGQFYIMDNFVAGKETAIFITFEEPPKTDSVMILTIEKGGEYIASLSPDDFIDDKTVIFRPESLIDVNGWDQGAYTFTFDMDESQAIRTTNFYKSIPLKILAVPVLANYSGKVRGVEGDWKKGGTMITAAYPVAKNDVEFVLHPEIDLSDDKYDLDNKEGRWNVWAALNNLQTPAQDYDLIVGYIRNPAGNGKYLGYTYGSPANIVSESTPDLLATVVHEIAHCYLVGDEYEGGSLNDELNSPPYRMQGKDIVTKKPSAGTKENVVGGFDYGENASGSVIYPEQRPYWVEGRESLGVVTSYMGSGTGEDSFKFWTTSDIWNHLFNVFTGQIPMVGASGGGDDSREAYDEDYYWGKCQYCNGDIYDPPFYIQCHNCCEFSEVTDDIYDCEHCGEQIVVLDYYDVDLAICCTKCDSLTWYAEYMDYCNITDVLQINGYIDTDGTFVSYPWYTFEVEPYLLTANKNGGYSVCIYDSKEKLLTKTYFDVVSEAQVTTAEGQEFLEDERIPILVITKFFEEAERIVIKKGDEEVYSRIVTKNAPVVEFTGIEPYQNIGNNFTLNWNAHDEDGDELFFDIYYQYNDESLYLVAEYITGRSFDLDLTEYPGTYEGYFTIYATDGVNTGEDTSNYVTIPFKAPEFLTTQKEIPQFKTTEQILYEIEVFDAQDKWLRDETVEWFYEGEFFHRGDILLVWAYELEPGIHTFIAKATNSEGLSSSKEYSVEIIDDESDLPDDWSREDIKYAIKLGMRTSLTRIDAPVTRIEFAYNMQALLYYMRTYEVPEMRLDDFGVDILDCGVNDTYDAARMVYLGLMDAPNGMFEPQKPVTEKEAALILYKIANMAYDPDITAADFNASDDEWILEDLAEWGIFDKSGENILQEDKNISNKLFMARLGRMIQLILE